MNRDPLIAERSPTGPEAPESGRAYWRSLEERAVSGPSPDDRFPTLAADLMRRAGTVDRRRFLELMAASIGLAGLAGCRRPEAHILPYTRLPEAVVPGLPTFYATALPRRGSAVPILVESHEGRPTKIEGNPRFAGTGGATDARAQAAILELYDPDRSGTVLRRESERTEASTWETFDRFADTHFAGLRSARGRGLRFLSGDINSPALDLLREHLQKTMPEARWHGFEPIDDDRARAGAALALGTGIVPRYRLDRASVLLAVDADVLGNEGDSIRYVREFSEARRADREGESMNRLYVVEPHFSVTGGMADHRLRLAAGQIEGYLLALAREVLGDDRNTSEAVQKALADRAPKVTVDPRWIKEVAADLRAHQGRSLVAVGRRQPPLAHALAHAMNAALGNTGATVEYRHDRREGIGTIVELAEAIKGGSVDTLVILGGNPAHDALADLDLAALLGHVPHTIRLGTHVDETSTRCGWHLPASHFLESWGDARADDGTLLPIQPLIEPLFAGRCELEVVARLIGFEVVAPYEIVRRSFRRSAAGPHFEAAWRKFLHEGLSAATGQKPVTPALRWEAIAQEIASAPAPAPAPSAEALELVFAADPSLDDGRHANNGWLQELPDPITKLTWDNAGVMSPATAQALRVATGDVVKLDLGGRAIEIAALVLPGSADFSIAVALGYGRTAVGRVGKGIGVNVYPLRTTGAPEFAQGLRASRTGRKHALAITQDHFRMEGRQLIREIELISHKDSSQSHEGGEHSHGKEHHPDIQVRPTFNGEHQWGMAIDLNTCVGCNACTVACQAENNIPIVGKDEVIGGREMHWIRIDRYFAGDDADPGMVHQPVACVQCENAPCEVVCPVNAAVHNNEGINLQVYNRCIGTRYCGNNCPYKVRRFNFFDYNQRPLDKLHLGPMAPKGMPELVQMQKNPDVTVRMRGVMEKCTYCVQRIERARIGMRVAAGDSPEVRVPDGTIVPACAQACPAQAIVFGDISDPESRVSKVKRESRDYSLLGELNTKPRTTYQARLRNLNPRMPAAGDGSVDEGRTA